MTLHWLATILAPFFISVGQLCLKKGTHNSATLWGSLRQPLVLLGYALSFAATLLLVYGMQQIPLKTSSAITATSFGLVAVFGKLFLDEHLSRMKITGIVLIISGVILFNL